MRLSSRGLGRMVLPIDLAGSRLDLTRDHVVLSGVIREGKVRWEYRIKMTEEDFLGFCRLALRRDVLDFLARTQGVSLLGTFLTGIPGFVAGLVRKCLGLGAPCVDETAIPVGPKATRPSGEASDGVLVQGTR